MIASGLQTHPIMMWEILEFHLEHCVDAAFQLDAMTKEVEEMCKLVRDTQSINQRMARRAWPPPTTRWPRWPKMSATSKTTSNALTKRLNDPQDLDPF